MEDALNFESTDHLFVVDMGVFEVSIEGIIDALEIKTLLKGKVVGDAAVGGNAKGEGVFGRGNKGSAVLRDEPRLSREADDFAPQVVHDPQPQNASRKLSLDGRCSHEVAGKQRRGFAILVDVTAAQPA